MADVVIATTGTVADLERLRIAVRRAVQGAITGTLEDAFKVADAKVPVRKVFAGGRRTLRFASRAETADANRLYKAMGGGRQYKPLVAKPSTIHTTPSSRLGKQFYRIVADRPQRYNKRGQPIATMRSGRNKANDLDPRLPLGPGGKKQRGNYRQVDFGFFPTRNDPSKKMQRFGLVDANGNHDAAAESLLTSRGFSELVTGKAVFSGKGGATIGGRLKGELDIMYPLENLIMKGRVVSPTSYARFVELGTRHAAAQPYLRPALAAVHQSYRANIVKALAKVGSRRISGRDVAADKRSSISGFKDAMK